MVLDLSLLGDPPRSVRWVTLRMYLSREAVTWHILDEVLPISGLQLWAVRYAIETINGGPGEDDRPTQVSNSLARGWDAEFTLRSFVNSRLLACDLVMCSRAMDAPFGLMVYSAPMWLVRP